MVNWSLVCGLFIIDDSHSVKPRGSAPQLGGRACGKLRTKSTSLQETPLARDGFLFSLLPSLLEFNIAGSLMGVLRPLYSWRRAACPWQGTSKLYKWFLIRFGLVCWLLLTRDKPPCRACLMAHGHSGLGQTDWPI